MTYLVENLTGAVIVFGYVWYADSAVATILWQLRMPQTMMGVLGGAFLGLAGLQMRTFLGNPLASPFKFGFSTTAGFGAALAIVFGGMLAMPAYIVTPITAFAITLNACGMIYLITRFLSSSPAVLILGGIAVLLFFQTIQSLLQFMASPGGIQQIVFWLFRSLLKSIWTSVYVTSAILAVCLPLIMRIVRP